MLYCLFLSSELQQKFLLLNVACLERALLDDLLEE